MVLFHEAFPGGYLLILAPDPNATILTDAGLADHLDLACRSGLPVWVDCRLLDTVSATAVWLLWASYHRLRRQHRALILCHVPQPAEYMLREVFHGTDLRLVTSLDDCMFPIVQATSMAA